MRQRGLTVRAAMQAMAMCCAGLLVAVLLGQTTVFQRIDAMLMDSQHRNLGQRLDLSGVVILDVDEESRRHLAARLGPWPYDFTPFATVTQYLAAKGARAIAFDLLFSDERQGMAEMRAALAPNVVLGAVGVPVTLPQPPTYNVQLERLALSRQPVEAGPESAKALRREAPLPHLPWTALKLPIDGLTPVPGPRIGIVNLQPDDDGILRRLALFQSTQGFLFPSFALATQLAADPSIGEMRLDGRRLSLHRLSLPLTREGDVLLRFPTNLDDLRSVPFHEVFNAAESRAPSGESLGRTFAGKTVIVGSSTRMGGENVFTPAGRMSALEFAALSHAALGAGFVVTPAQPWIDSLLVLVALLVPLWLSVKGGAERTGRDFLLAFALIAIVPAAAGTALGAVGMESRALFAFVAGTATLAMVFSAWLFTLSDERRRLRYETMAARETTRLKGEFLNHLAHELRTPLTAVMGFNKLNQFTDDLGRESRIKNSAIIGRNCEYLLQVITNQLDLAKLEAGAISIAPAPEDPDALLRDVLERMQPFADERRLRLRYSRTTPLPGVLALDAFRVRQVLINLLGNALKFTQAGSVDLVASWHVATLVIEVRDTGPGIAPDAVGRIFHAYEQADDTIAHRYGGTGLGLAITRELVELMGGNIEVESRLGRGSVFRVRIPSEVVEGRANTHPITEAHAMREPLAGRVLVAEDNEDIRTLVEMQIGKLGVDVVSVANGFSAVESALSERFDAVLMDMEMPVMNGFEAVNVLRTRGYSGPILAFTAHHEGLEVDRALGAGCDGVVTKPVTLESLRAALRPLLREGRQPRVAAAGRGAR
jgi:signal transduction histidine kinase/CheY-like chemotaxis protein